VIFVLFDAARLSPCKEKRAKGAEKIRSRAAEVRLPSPIPYDGSIVNMGVKDGDGNVCYLIGLLKAIRLQLGKGDGDSVHVVIRERE
jgi:hypothetical protein